MREIEGTIQYKITIDDGNWDLSYTQSSQNDLAIMAIGQQLMEYSEQHFQETIKVPDITTKVKKLFKGRLDKVRAAKFGLQMMCAYLMDVIDEYHAYAEQNKDKAPEPMTEEEQKKIIKMMNKSIQGQA